MEGGAHSLETPAAKAFVEAMEEYSAKVDLQPGDLLLVDESKIFHRGHSGDPDALKNILPDDEISRFLVHTAGAPSDSFAR